MPPDKLWIFDLPEVQDLVFAHDGRFSRQEYGQLQLVCKAWHGMICPFLWYRPIEIHDMLRRFAFTDYIQPSTINHHTIKSVPFLEKNAQWIRELDISIAETNHNQVLRLSSLENRFCTNLKRLSITEIGGANEDLQRLAGMNFIRLNPGLVYLYYCTHSYRRLEIQSLASVLLESCPVLTELFLRRVILGDGELLQTVLTLIPTIRSVTLDRCFRNSKFSSQEWKPNKVQKWCFRNFHDSETKRPPVVVATGGGPIPGAGVAGIVDAMHNILMGSPDLEDLEMEVNNGQEELDQLPILFATKVRNVKKLKLMAAPFMDDLAANDNILATLLESIGPHSVSGGGLVDLHLVGMQVGDAFGKALIGPKNRHQDSLKELNLSNCSELTAAMVSCIVSKLPYLQVINVINPFGQVFAVSDFFTPRQPWACSDYLEQLRMSFVVNRVVNNSSTSRRSNDSQANLNNNEEVSLLMGQLSRFSQLRDLRMTLRNRGTEVGQGNWQPVRNLLQLIMDRCRRIRRFEMRFVGWNVTAEEQEEVRKACNTTWKQPITAMNPSPVNIKILFDRS